MPAPLIDKHGRVHTNLRISVTDRCNIRCFYCMPEENVVFRPRDEILSFEEITRFTRVATGLGIDRVRLTGGEPLVRRGLPELVRMLRDISGLRDIALTTNGILLADQARALKDAGLTRINISLDGMTEETFRRITRREGLARVLEGIDAAIEVDFEKIRLNAIAIRGITEDEIVPLAHFARERELELRFIEFMPLDADEKWQSEQVLPGEEIRRILEQTFTTLVAAQREDPSQPAVDYEFADGGGRIGLINPVSEPFCHACNRLRLTAEGKIRNCLFSLVEWDARAILRGPAGAGRSDRESDGELAALIRDCVSEKKPGHGIDSDEFLRPQKSMYQIGG